MNRIALIAAALASLLVACAGPQSYASMGSQPAGLSQGEPAPTAEPALLTIRVAPLPPPEQVREGCESYTAWVRVGDQLHRVGPVEYDRAAGEGHLSLRAVAPEFELLVSAETDEAASRPGRVVVRRLISG